MFQIDEKCLADGRSLITVQKNKDSIDIKQKNGTINFTSDLGDLWLTTPKVREAYVNKENPIQKLDKILTASNGTDVSGDLSFNDPIDFKNNVTMRKNLTIKGNLLVQGNTTTIDTPNLTIEDNIIELNKNETSVGLTLGIAGIAINRGASQFARTLFNETDKAFVTEVNAEIDGVLSENWITKAYSEKVGSHLKGELEIKHLLLTPNAKITGTLNAANTTLDRVVVENESTFNGAITANSTSLFKGMLTVDNKAKLNSTLEVVGASTLKGAVRLNSSIIVDTTSLLKGAVDMNNTLTITAGGANITGAGIFNNALTVKDNGIFEKDLSIAAMTTTHNLTVANKTLTNTLEVSGRSQLMSTNIGGSLSVGGNAIITGTLTARDKTYLEGDLNLRGSALIKSSADIKGNLSVQADTTMLGNLEVRGAINSKGGIVVEGNQSISGDISASEYLGNNYRIRPLDGNGIEFWANSSNDKFKISMSSTSNQTLGGKITEAADSDYNMYFDMKEGTNRGFVFKNNGTPVFHVEGSGIVRAKSHMYANNSKVLTVANEGHGKGIDADTIDGKHHSDLQAEFVNVTGDKMTGTLTIEKASNQLNLSNGTSKTIVSTSATEGEYIFGGTLISESEYIKDYIRISRDRLAFTTNNVTHLVYHQGNKPNWSDIGSKPTLFPPGVHNHDDRYFTETEITNKFNEVENRISQIEDKIGKTKTVSVNTADWVLNSSTKYYEKTVAHNMNININSLEVRFFDENNTSVMASYDFINSNTIKIYNDEASILTVVICGVTYLNKNLLDDANASLDMLNKKISKLESLVYKHFEINS